MGAIQSACTDSVRAPRSASAPVRSALKSRPPVAPVDLTATGFSQPSPVRRTQASHGAFARPVSTARVITPRVLVIAGPSARAATPMARCAATAAQCPPYQQATRHPAHTAPVSSARKAPPRVVPSVAGPSLARPQLSVRAPPAAVRSQSANGPVTRTPASGPWPPAGAPSFDGSARVSSTASPLHRDRGDSPRVGRQPQHRTGPSAEKTPSAPPSLRPLTVPTATAATVAAAGSLNLSSGAAPRAPVTSQATRGSIHGLRLTTPRTGTNKERELGVPRSAASGPTRSGVPASQIAAAAEAVEHDARLHAKLRQTGAQPDGPAPVAPAAPSALAIVSPVCAEPPPAAPASQPNTTRAVMPHERLQQRHLQASDQQPPSDQLPYHRTITSMSAIQPSVMCVSNQTQEEKSSAHADSVSFVKSQQQPAIAQLYTPPQNLTAVVRAAVPVASAASFILPFQEVGGVVPSAEYPLQQPSLTGALPASGFQQPQRQPASSTNRCAATSSSLVVRTLTSQVDEAPNGTATAIASQTEQQLQHEQLPHRVTRHSSAAEETAHDNAECLVNRCIPVSCRRCRYCRWCRCHLPLCLVTLKRHVAPRPTSAGPLVHSDGHDPYIKRGYQWNVKEAHSDSDEDTHSQEAEGEFSLATADPSVLFNRPLLGVPTHSCTLEGGPLLTSVVLVVPAAPYNAMAAIGADGILVPVRDLFLHPHAVAVSGSNACLQMQNRSAGAAPATRLNAATLNAPFAASPFPTSAIRVPLKPQPQQVTDIRNVGPLGVAGSSASCILDALLEVKRVTKSCQADVPISCGSRATVGCDSFPHPAVSVPHTVDLATLYHAIAASVAASTNLSKNGAAVARIASRIIAASGLASHVLAALSAARLCGGLEGRSGGDLRCVSAARVLFTRSPLAYGSRDCADGAAMEPPAVAHAPLLDVGTFARLYGCAPCWDRQYAAIGPIPAPSAEVLAREAAVAEAARQRDATTRALWCLYPTVGADPFEGIAIGQQVYIEGQGLVTRGPDHMSWVRPDGTRLPPPAVMAPETAGACDGDVSDASSCPAPPIPSVASMFASQCRRGPAGAALFTQAWAVRIVPDTLAAPEPPGTIGALAALSLEDQSVTRRSRAAPTGGVSGCGPFAGLARDPSLRRQLVRAAVDSAAPGRIFSRTGPLAFPFVTAAPQSRGQRMLVDAARELRWVDAVVSRPSEPVAAAIVANALQALMQPLQLLC